MPGGEDADAVSPIPSDPKVTPVGDSQTPLVVTEPTPVSTSRDNSRASWGPKGDADGAGGDHPKSGGPVLTHKLSVVRAPMVTAAELASHPSDSGPNMVSHPDLYFLFVFPPSYLTTAFPSRANALPTRGP